PARAIPGGDRRRASRGGVRARRAGRRDGGPRGGPARAEARAARLPAGPPAHRPAATEADHRVEAPCARAVAARAALPRRGRVRAGSRAAPRGVAGEARGAESVAMRGPESISPTAHYTGHVWRRNGLSHEELGTLEGRLLFEALEPAMRASRAVGGPTLE